MRLLALPLLALLAAAAPLRAQDGGASADDARWDARLGAVSGDVVVRPAEGGDEAAGEADMPLAQGDRVEVPEGGSAEVTLDDGSLITLSGGARFTLEKTERAESSFFLEAGSLLAKIQKLMDGRLRVRTPTAVAAVRGTELGVEVDGGDTHVGVFDEGKVDVTGAAGGPAETLISNQETSVSAGGAPARAAGLRRFAKRRALMRAHKRKLAALRQRYQRLTSAARRERRAQVLARLRERRRAMREKAQKANRQGREKAREREQHQRERLQENRRRMEQQRERFRRGGPRGPGGAPPPGGPR